MKAGAAVSVGLLLALGGLATSLAQPKQTVIRYAFQADCYRLTSTAACNKPKTGTQLELGPQIAVWLESADRKTFVDTLLVTRAVAIWGIGNRPGAWNLPSSPKFPYGKRVMALPVWAYTRGRLYDPVVMQDRTNADGTTSDKEYWLGFHESISSPDPYYCRPMSYSEIDVDAISCPTRVFNSAKGKFDRSGAKVYYPPRNDLPPDKFTDRDCDELNQRATTCMMSARQYADLNDLDAVAAATKPYGNMYTGRWTVPADLPDGDYALVLEINKEFDQNASYMNPAYTDPNLSDSGLKNNFGQPSVLFRVPFKLSRTVAFQGGAMDIAGYGDWDGRTGTLHPADSTISEAPGSGRGRLLPFAQPSTAGGAPIMARFHVATEVPETPPPPPPDAGPVPDGGVEVDAAPVARDAGTPTCDPVRAMVMVSVPMGGARAESADVEFVEPDGSVFNAIDEYRVRHWSGDDTSPGAFDRGIPDDSVAPGAAGRRRQIEINNLKSEQTYTVGIKPTGRCLDGAIGYAKIATVTRKFTQLHGCFIATAAYGTAQAADVEALRRWRDRARDGGAFGAALVALYERSSPPLARLLGGSDDGRAAVRQALAPIVNAAKATQVAAPARR
jgi:hypothetical protein